MHGAKEMHKNLHQCALQFFVKSAQKIAPSFALAAFESVSLKENSKKRVEREELRVMSWNNSSLVFYLVKIFRF
ncbi:MAG: hypothetical protein WA584_10115 [Pyrinomonadaceae bacterium]